MQGEERGDGEWDWKLGERRELQEGERPEEQLIALLSIMRGRGVCGLEARKEMAHSI